MNETHYGVDMNRINIIVQYPRIDSKYISSLRCPTTMVAFTNGECTGPNADCNGLFFQHLFSAPFSRSVCFFQLFIFSHFSLLKLSLYLPIVYLSEKVLIFLFTVQCQDFPGFVISFSTVRFIVMPTYCLCPEIWMATYTLININKRSKSVYIAG